MALTTITQGNTADVTITDNGDVLNVIPAPGGSGKLTIVSGLSGFLEREFGGPVQTDFPASGVVRITATAGSVLYELGNGPSRGNAAIGAQPEDILTTKQISAIVAGTPATLTNPTLQATNSVNNYTQISIQNKSAGANASADLIAYPDNVTSSDLTGFMDVGITSSAYAQAAYAITVANEGYVFMSAPSGASKTGNMIIATDSTGSTNDIIFGTNGFASLTNRKYWMSGGSGVVGFGVGAKAAANAVISATSTTQGVQLPVMTTTQKNAIAGPTPGLLVYDSTLGKLCIRVAAAWETVTSA